MKPYTNTHIKNREAATILLIVAGAATVAAVGITAVALGKAVLRLNPLQRRR